MREALPGRQAKQWDNERVSSRTLRISMAQSLYESGRDVCPAGAGLGLCTGSSQYVGSSNGKVITSWDDLRPLPRLDQSRVLTNLGGPLSDRKHLEAPGLGMLG